MSADTSDLTKVDSAVGGVGEDEVHEVRKPVGGRTRKSSSYPGVKNIGDLEAEGADLHIAAETQKLGWKMNDSTKNVDDPAVLNKPLTEPPIKKIDLVFPLGMTVTARNIKGVTIKDALDAIHKQFKKKADDEMEEPYLKGFEWDKTESYTQLKIHMSKTSTAPPMSGGKKKKNKGTEEE